MMHMVLQQAKARTKKQQRAEHRSRSGSSHAVREPKILNHISHGKQAASTRAEQMPSYAGEVVTIPITVTL